MTEANEIQLNTAWAEGLAKMDRFTLLNERCTIGFQQYIRLDLHKPIPEQLALRNLIIRKSVENPGDIGAIRRFVESNSSLRVDFGWSFESAAMYEEMMQECIDTVVSKYNIAVGCMITDAQCSWLGFMPLNIFERAAIEELGLRSLILYNNELINFQEEVVSFVANHKLFRQHSIVRNDQYRFKYFKAVRKNEDALVDAFWFYHDAVKETSLLHMIPRDILEEQIGCHFLHYPDKFFELLEFVKLKGELYE